MAKTAAPVTAGKAIDPPTGQLETTTFTLPAHTFLHRVHETKFSAISFNPGFGDARFSPINDALGAAVPTMYAGNTLSCALMESVFHEVPYSVNKPTYDKADLDGQSYSVIVTNSPLELIDLRSIALRKLAVERHQLIDTESSQYPITRKWAAAIHAQELTAQGLLWTSRQDDSSRAVILFGDRILPGDISQVRASQSLEVDLYSEVVSLAQSIGLLIVDSRI